MAATLEKSLAKIVGCVRQAAAARIFQDKAAQALFGHFILAQLQAGERRLIIVDRTGGWRQGGGDRWRRQRRAGDQGRRGERRGTRIERLNAGIARRTQLARLAKLNRIAQRIRIIAGADRATGQDGCRARQGRAAKRLWRARRVGLARRIKGVACGRRPCRFAQPAGGQLLGRAGSQRRQRRGRQGGLRGGGTRRLGCGTLLYGRGLAAQLLEAEIRVGLRLAHLLFEFFLLELQLLDQPGQRPQLIVQPVQPHGEAGRVLRAGRLAGDTHYTKRQNRSDHASCETCHGNQPCPGVRLRPAPAL